VFIFVDAHTMREEAQNALLKLVEEPPRHVVMVFITTNPDAILYTIRSRCQRIRFTPLPTSVVEQVLTSYYAADAETARRAAAMSQGSIERARALVESFDDNERDAAAAFVEGMTKGGRAWALGQALAMGRGANREGVARFLDEVAVMFRDIMAGDPDLYINRDIASRIDAIAASWDRGTVPQVIDRIAIARNQILLANASVDSTLADLFLDLKRAG
jgi:DNA polymerase-3 subunit delta'